MPWADVADVVDMGLGSFGGAVATSVAGPPFPPPWLSSSALDFSANVSTGSDVGSDATHCTEMVIK